MLYVNDSLRLLNDSRFHDTPEIRPAVTAALAEMGLDLPFAEPPPDGPRRFA